MILDNHVHTVKVGFMEPIRVYTPTEQIAGALRDLLKRGHWSGTLPGIYQLASELGVSRRLVEGAIAQLEKEGLLIPHGAGKRREIAVIEDHAPREFHIAILLYEDEDRQLERFLQLLSTLKQSGFNATFARKTLLDLDMNKDRVAKFVENTKADAWIVVAGSREILEWFAAQPQPAFAWFGRIGSRTIRLAGTYPVKKPALTKAIDQLVELGHNRIVMMVREERLVPTIGLFERIFLEELQKHGITTSSYNLPVWKNSKEGLHRCLDSLCSVTPPTALIISEAILFWPALQHLAERGIHSPGDISLICLDPDPTFAWTKPEISHISWETKPMIRHILTWAEHVRRGEDYFRQTQVKARFIQGGTVGKNAR